MKLFCAVCEKEVTDNIAVFENIDGVIVHCGDCNYPLLFVPYDEPGWFGNPLEDTKGSCKEPEEIQPDLFDDECSCDDCCEDKLFEDIKEKVAFTAEDIDYLHRLVEQDVLKLNLAYDMISSKNKIRCEKGCLAAVKVYDNSLYVQILDAYLAASTLQDKLATLKELRKQ